MHLTQTIYLTKNKYKDFNSQLTLISKNLKNQANFLLKQASSYHYYQKEIKRFQNLIQDLDLSKTDNDLLKNSEKNLGQNKNKKDNLKKKLEKQLNFSETIFKSLHIDYLKEVNQSIVKFNQFQKEQFINHLNENQTNILNNVNNVNNENQKPYQYKIILKKAIDSL